jgi:hypothetical protein
LKRIAEKDVLGVHSGHMVSVLRGRSLSADTDAPGGGRTGSTTAYPKEPEGLRR